MGSLSLLSRRLDRIAEELESKGMVDLAARVDRANWSLERGKEPRRVGEELLDIRDAVEQEESHDVRRISRFRPSRFERPSRLERSSRLERPSQLERPSRLERFSRFERPSRLSRLSRLSSTESRPSRFSRFASRSENTRYERPLRSRFARRPYSDRLR